MRYTLYITLAILLATASCRTINVPETRTESGPYVQLKNGKKYEGTSAQRSTGIFVKDKVILGDTSFRTKDVSFYSTGGMTYANVSRRSFAPQVAAGKINLYKYEYISVSSDGHGNTSAHKHISYYIQKKEGSPLETLGYNNLYPMVEKRTPEFDMLERYRKTRVISRGLGYGSLALIAGGVFLASSSNSNVGGALVGVGVAAFIGWAAVKIPNQVRLLKTVLIADKADSKRGSHKRVK